MTPEFLRGFLRAGVFISVVSLVMIFAVQRESAEFVVSVCSLGMGLTLVGLIVLITRIGER